MRPGRNAAVLVLALLVASVTAQPASTAGAAGELRVRERVVQTGQIAIEGAFRYLRVTRTRSGRVVHRSRAFSRRLSARLRLRPGFYRVSSWTRNCSGSCDRLDPPSERCRGHFRVRAARYVTATIHSGAGIPCRITNP